MRRRRLVVAGATAVALAAVTVPAWAYVTTSRTQAVQLRAGLLQNVRSLRTTPTVSGPDDGAVTLTWSLSTDENVAPDAYRVERATLPDNTWTTLRLGAPTCGTPGTCTVVDPTAALNTSYRYRVTSTRGTTWAGTTSPAALAASLGPTSVRVGSVWSTLASVAIGPANRLVAVGSRGEIVVCVSACAAANPVWAEVNSHVVADLHRVVIQGGAAWAVGDHGTILRCTGGCDTSAPTWTGVTSPTAQDLYGVYASSGYVVVVGANGAAYYSADGIGWHAVAFDTPVPAGTTLNAITGLGAGNVAVVGSGGFIAGCVASATTGTAPTTGTATATCGDGDHPMTVQPRAAHDLRDVTAVAGRFTTVGGSGTVMTAGSAAGPWSALTGIGASDLTAVATVGTDETVAAGAAGVWLRCAATGCSPLAPAPGYQVNGLVATVTGTPGVARYWAVGGTDAVPKSSYLDASARPAAWAQAALPSSVDPGTLKTGGDGRTVALATLPAGEAPPASCPAPSLRADVTVPASTLSPVPVRRVSARVGYALTGAAPRKAWLLAALNGGSWVSAELGGAAASGGSVPVVTVAFPAAAFPSSGWTAGGDDTLHLCLVGSATAPTMTVDLLHVDVNE